MCVVGHIPRDHMVFLLDWQETAYSNPMTLQGPASIQVLVLLLPTIHLSTIRREWWRRVVSALMWYHLYWDLIFPSANLLTTVHFQDMFSKNITILESPPLLDSPSSDIFPYNSNSFSLAQQLGIRFAGTLIGEQHLWTDGYHVLKNSRPLLLKSVAAAVVGVNPRQHYGLPRPPYGQYGPWAAPKGRGIMPNFRDLASAQPFTFRRLGPIRPLMNNPVRRP